VVSGDIGDHGRYAKATNTSMTSDAETTERDTEIRTSFEICHNFLTALRFIVMDTARDPKYFETHLLSYVAQDLIEASVAIPLLVQQGIRNTCRRDLRFMLESTIKLAYIHQQDYASEIGSKLATFRSDLNSSKISVKNDVNLSMIEESLRDSLQEDTGRLYGETSNYVHLTANQIQQRIAEVNSGRTVGHESANDVRALNLLLSRGLALSLVFLFHAVPEYVAGDWLVQADGLSNPWYYRKSRFLASMDAHFDYKHERQSSLTEIRAMRLQDVTF